MNRSCSRIVHFVTCYCVQEFAIQNSTVHVAVCRNGCGIYMLCIGADAELYVLLCTGADAELYVLLCAGAVQEYDSTCRLDTWYTTLLLRIKKQIPVEDDLC
jgi:hypothetical protein